jgi:cytochrome c-type biogenesis protein CcmE
MNRKHKIKLAGILTVVILISAAIGLTLFALKQNINLFYTPTQLKLAHLTANQNVRIGGYVKKASVTYDASGQNVHFIVTDRKSELTVNYNGVLPNLFREGQVVVVTGKVINNQLNAFEVLAKHDEKYMPKPLEKELKQGGDHVS